MTLEEYEKFIISDIQEEVLEKIYLSPKYVNKNGKMTILHKRLETFFEQELDSNRNENIRKAYEYGYTNAEIAEFLNLSFNTIKNILKY